MANSTDVQKITDEQWMSLAEVVMKVKNDTIELIKLEASKTVKKFFDYVSVNRCKSYTIRMKNPLVRKDMEELSLTADEIERLYESELKRLVKPPFTVKFIELDREDYYDEAEMKEDGDDDVGGEYEDYRLNIYDVVFELDMKLYDKMKEKKLAGK